MAIWNILSGENCGGGRLKGAQDINIAAQSAAIRCFRGRACLGPYRYRIPRNLLTKGFPTKGWKRTSRTVKEQAEAEVVDCCFVTKTEYKLGFVFNYVL